MKLIFCVQVNIKLSFNLMLSILLSIFGHAQITKNSKFAQSLQYFKNGQVYWLSCVMGIIPFICQLKIISNGYFYLENEVRALWSSNNILLFIVV